MATFLNKKEQVYDLKLTSYGRYLLSIGTFKPVYYAFFDDNVIYDLRYTTSSVGTFANTTTEGQNNINVRVKTNTPYLESLVLFRDVETTLSELDADATGFDSDRNPTLTKPASDIYTFESALGDAMIDSENPQAVPSWKLLMMQGNISSSVYRGAGKLTPPVGLPAIEQEAEKGILLNSQIPQISVDAYYTLKVTDSSIDLDPDSARSLVDTAGPFSDGKYIKLEATDPLIYLEEINTQLLTENFDIEVFEVESGSFAGVYSPTLHRKYFERQIPQIENGFMVTEIPVANPVQNLTTASVEYYFDVLTDASVDQTIACQGLETFEKGSYYIDFDFDCEDTTTTATFYDIYGSVTEPEICQD
jgi:hypothetical protein